VASLDFLSRPALGLPLQAGNEATLASVLSVVCFSS